jgi:hypothetical protein
MTLRGPGAARPVLDSLGALVGGRVRLWRFDGRGLREAGGADPGWTPTIPRGPGLVPTPTGAVWLEAVDGVEGFWIEVDAGGEAAGRLGAARISPIVAALLDAERQRAFIAEELAGRYEEIDLLYAISEILTTVRWRRATDHRPRGEHGGGRTPGVDHGFHETGVLRTVARGFGVSRWLRAGGGRLLGGAECTRAAHRGLRPTRARRRAGECGQTAAIGATRISACPSAMALRVPRFAAWGSSTSPTA